MLETLNIINPVDRHEKANLLAKRITWITFLLMQLPVCFLFFAGNELSFGIALGMELTMLIVLLLHHLGKTSSAILIAGIYFYPTLATFPYVLEIKNMGIICILTIFVTNTYFLIRKRYQFINITFAILAIAIHYVCYYIVDGFNLVFALEICVCGTCLFIIFFIINFFKSDVDIFQQKLQATNSFLTQITDLNPHFIYAKDTKDRFIFLNKTMSEFYGYSPDEMIGKKVKGFYESRTIINNATDSLSSIKTDRKYSLVTATDKNNQATYLELIQTPMLNKNAKTNSILGVAINVTESRKAKQALYKSEQRYRKLYENNQLGIVTTINQRFATVNDTFCKMTGYERAEIIGKKVNDIMHSEDYVHNQKNVEQIDNQSVNGLVFEHRFVRKDLSIGYALVHLQVILHKENQPFEGIATLTDISQLKTTEQALRKSETLYRTLTNHAFDGIEIHESTPPQQEEDQWHHSLIARNNRVYEILGKTKENIKQTSFSNQDILAMSPQYQPNGIKSEDYMGNILNEFRENSVVNFEWQYGNELIAIDTEMSIIRFEVEGKQYITTIYKDITEKKKAERTIQDNLNQLNQKNQELKKFIKSNMQLENFAYLASHDLKEPIRSIVGFSQLLKRSTGNKLTETEQEYIDFVIKSSKNMNMLVEDLLTYSRVNTEDKKIQTIKLDDVLFTINYELNVLIKQKNARIQYENLPETIQADQVQIRQLFQNLITNAIRYSAEERPPLIHITAKENEKEWEFTVSDNGIGIKSEFYDRIFLLFRKLHNDRDKGTGIGLALCKKIVENHGGRIWVDSKYGEGSTFYFTICKHQEQ